MNPQKILDLFGHSANHPQFEQVFKDLNIEDRPVAKKNSWGGIDINSVENSEIAIQFEFTTIISYEYGYGKPKSKFIDDKYELILEQVTFGNMTVYPYTFPFYLAFEDKYETICDKIGSKPFEKREGIDYKFAYWFIKDDFKILTALNESKQLLWLRIFALDLASRKSIALQKSLREQNKNIITNYLKDIEELKSSLPTNEWHNRLNEGDSCFSEINIQASNEILNNFVDNLKIAVSEKKASKVFSSLKKAVVAFNKINPKYDYFIETNEREELIEFFEKAIKLSGFKIEEGLDITQDFRQW